MTSRTLALTAAALTVAATIVAQGPRRDGQWQVTIEMQMPGMNMPLQMVTQCITPAEAADPQKALPQTGPVSDCKFSNYKVDGNKVTWAMVCEQQKISGSAEMVYAGEAYTGTMKMKAEGQEMTFKYSGKRLGDCTK